MNMLQNPVFYLVAALCLSLVSPMVAHAQEGDRPLSISETDPSEINHVEFRLRIGYGGFRDSRSPDGGLDGVQGAVDIKVINLPLTLTYSRERYTNSTDPTNRFEIASMDSLSLLFNYRLPSFERVVYLVGGGFGRLNVPVGPESPDSRIREDLYSLEAGIYLEVWKGFGAYGTLKYLNAEKTTDNEREIDFKETILLVGVSYTFGL